MVGYAELSLTVEPGINYIARVEFRSEAKATVWIEVAATGMEATTMDTSPKET